MKWTDVQLSMLLSHVAAGGQLCCGHVCRAARDAAWTIVVNGPGKRRNARAGRLNWWAYHTLACQAADPWSGKQADWVLRNAEESCAFGGPA
jgi:hypothetical protein